MPTDQADSQIKAARAASPPHPSGSAARSQFGTPSGEPGRELTRRRSRTRSRKRRRVLLLCVCVVVAGAGVAVWRWWDGSDASAADSATAATKVVRRDFTSSVLATGAVKPQVGAEVRVGARITGKVVRLRANIGDSVQKGQVIAELEKGDLEATVGQRQAELDLAKAKLAAVELLSPQKIEKARADCMRWEASVQRSKLEKERADSLRPANAIAESDYDLAVSNYETDKAQLASAKESYALARNQYAEDHKQASADLARAESALKYAQAMLSYATLTAPISGVIASVSTQEGETVAAGLMAPTFVTIIDLDRLEVDAMVDEVDIGKVRVGQQAMFTVDAFPAREFPGKVVAIYPNAILLENVVYYDVVIEIQGNEDKVLRPQMTAAATIFLDAKTGVLAVPAKAVKREQGKNVVYVMQDGQPQPREVKVGWKDGTWIEVVAGLTEGETILETAPADKPETR